MPAPDSYPFSPAGAARAASIYAGTFYAGTLPSFPPLVNCLDFQPLLVTPAQGSVSLTLSKPETGRVIAEATGFVQGSGPVPLSAPELSEGGYTLTVAGEGADGGAFFESAEVRVEAASTILFLETDKPIYKPGQQVNIRALRLDQDLKPRPGPLTVEVQDAKGIKVYKRTVDVDRFGMTNATMPLSTEPNLGVWKLSADSGDTTTQLDVRVEEYVLPKYEITLDLLKDWVLGNEAVTGTVSAEYSFGKPVRGEVDIIASRYLGVWEEYANFAKEIDGEASFELPAPGYVAGTPAAAGQGNLLLDVAVREPSTGYVEQTSHLMTVADSPVNLEGPGNVFILHSPSLLRLVAQQQSLPS